MKKHIPNLITMGNLICGCIGIGYAVHDQIALTGIFLMSGIFLDFFDGLAARWLNVSSELGTQLDSLADGVTSGVLPAMVMYQMLVDATGHEVFGEHLHWSGSTVDNLFWFVPLIAFAIAAASMYRLAVFNLDTRQTTSFIGLPTPANALFIVSLGYLAQHTKWDALANALDSVWVLLGLIVFSCWVLNSEIRLFAFKFKHFGWKGNEIRWLFAAGTLVALVLLQVAAVPIIILSYILISIFTSKKAVATA